MFFQPLPEPHNYFFLALPCESPTVRNDILFKSFHIALNRLYRTYDLNPNMKNKKGFQKWNKIIPILTEYTLNIRYPFILVGAAIFVSKV